MLQIVLGWTFIISTLVTMYLSIYNSTYFYFLSVPLFLITAIFLLFIFISGNTFGDSIFKVLKKLFFLHYYGLENYASGTKKPKMDTPIYTNVYLELKLKLKLKEIKN